jgi:hypothetical protein
VFNFLGYKRNANQSPTKISPPPVAMAIFKSKTATNAGDDVVKQEPYTLLVE